MVALLAQWIEALSGAGVAHVATDAGSVVGFSHALDDRITTLYVLATYHRRGLGRGLLARLREALAERGIVKARFAVLVLNTKAVAFYEAQGAYSVGSVIVEEFASTYEDLLFEIATDAAPSPLQPVPHSSVLL